MLHCYIATLLHCYIATLLHCYIATLLYCYIATLLHCYIVTLLHCYIATLLHCYIVTLFFRTGSLDLCMISLLTLSVFVIKSTIRSLKCWKITKKSTKLQFTKAFRFIKNPHQCIRVKHELTLLFSINPVWPARISACSTQF